MRRTIMARSFCVIALVAPICARPVRGQSATETNFQRGYFLQTHDRELDRAAQAFEQVVRDSQAPESLRAEAKSRLAQCREDLATADLARLMPPDALAYVEISRPGQHLAQLLKLVGLVRDPAAPSRSAAAQGTRFGPGLYFPDDFAVSPALLAELQRFRGVAAALTAIRPNGEPDGIVVLHPGDCDLLRGAIETAVQVLEPGEPIGEFRTYRVEHDVWITATARLFVAGRSRAALAGVIARLQDPNAASLANQEGFEELGQDRKDALLFAYGSGPKLVAQLAGQLHGQEAEIVRTVLDLDHLKAVSATLGTSDQGIHMKAKVQLAADHHSLAYGLIRTTPLTKRSLAHVPSGVAALALLGLNPPAPPVSSDPVPGPQHVTAMDIGRELFGNMEEVALFVLPGTAQSSAGGMPDVGAVIAVADPAKSEALWNQILSLVSLAAPAATQSSSEVTLGDHRGREYRFPGVPPITILRLKERAIVVGTRGAVTAAVAAGTSEKAIAQDPAFAGLLSGLTPSTSKAVLAHGGRLFPLVAAFAGGRHDPKMATVGSLMNDLTVSLMTDEQPTEFSIHLQIHGLPDVHKIVHSLTGPPSRTAGAGPSASPVP